jgi:hypothetical protein
MLKSILLATILFHKHPTNVTPTQDSTPEHETALVQSELAGRATITYIIL